MTWAHSPAYGTAVVLGPTQKAVYLFVMGATENGRRPSYTLAGIAEATGKPVSSVHDALGRLRALGLIGFAARMGRTGGHRLWRVARAARGTLDAIRRKRAIARITRRWYSGAPRPATAEVAPQAGTLWGDLPHGTGPDRESSDGWSGDFDHTTNDRGPSPFRRAMDRAGFRPWWRLADDDAGTIAPDDQGGRP